MKKIRSNFGLRSNPFAFIFARPFIHYLSQTIYTIKVFEVQAMDMHLNIFACNIAICKYAIFEIIVMYKIRIALYLPKDLQGISSQVCINQRLNQHQSWAHILSSPDCYSSTISLSMGLQDHALILVFVMCNRTTTQAIWTSYENSIPLFFRVQIASLP